MPFPRLAAFIAGLAIAGLATAGTVRAQAPATPPNQASEPAVPAPLQPGDAFGEEVNLPGKKVVYIVGRSAWDGAFDTLVDSYKSLNAYLDKQGLKPDGPAMTIYTETDDRGFSYQAAVPLAETPKEPPKGDIAMGQSPSGKMLKFVHRGSYDALDSTYEAITNYLDQKQLEAKDQFVEEYVSDILSSPPDNLVVNIYVPVK
jgi:effector-binding domain-containing protein